MNLPPEIQQQFSLIDLMPDGLKDLHQGDLLNRSKSFFKNRRFRIDYTVPDTVIDGSTHWYIQLPKSGLQALKKKRRGENES